MNVVRRYLSVILAWTLLVGCSSAADASSRTLFPTSTPESTLSPTSEPARTPAPTLRPPIPTTFSPLGQEIDAYLDSLVVENAFSGAVLVAQDGNVLLSEGYGLADREQGTANTSQTGLRICSITKQFTAMGILILQAEGQLDVYDPICRYVPECPPAWQRITIHHLLVHTSGIPDFANLPDYEATRHLPTTPADLVGRFRDLPLEFSPSDEWRYSNSGYIVLGAIIEQVSGQTYETFLREHIFDPLEMADSGYDHTLDGVAIGYTGQGENWQEAGSIDMSVPYAAGALYSTVEDMYRWDQALYTEQLIPQNLLDRMFTPYVDTPIGGYGYGWFITEQMGHRVARHGGGGDGFVGAIERYPDDRVTIIVLSNRETSDVGNIAREIACRVLD